MPKRTLIIIHIVYWEREKKNNNKKKEDPFSIEKQLKLKKAHTRGSVFSSGLNTKIRHQKTRENFETRTLIPNYNLKSRGDTYLQIFIKHTKHTHNTLYRTNIIYKI